MRSTAATLTTRESSAPALQVVFHAQMASEQGAFGLCRVCVAISDKMTRRHPHVFAGAMVEDAQAQTVAWEEHSVASAKPPAVADTSALSGIARGLPEWRAR